jgi:hypothetical protein
LGFPRVLWGGDPNDLGWSSATRYQRRRASTKDAYVSAGNDDGYRLVALDKSGNHSDPTAPVVIRVGASTIPAPAAPTAAFLSDPFPQTKLQFTQPATGLGVMVEVRSGENGPSPRAWESWFHRAANYSLGNRQRIILTVTELGGVPSSVKRRYAVRFALLAETRLRIGEAPTFRAFGFSSGYAVPRDHVSGMSGYLFATAQGRPWPPRNVPGVRRGIEGASFGPFPCFPPTWLIKNAVPGDLDASACDIHLKPLFDRTQGPGGRARSTALCAEG